jgi:hypothetical protein
MPEGYGSSHGVPALHINFFARLISRLLDYRKILDGKGFITLNNIKVRPLEPGPLQRIGLATRGGGDAHNWRIYATVAAADPFGHRLAAQPLRLLGNCQEVTST